MVGTIFVVVNSIAPLIFSGVVRYLKTSEEACQKSIHPSYWHTFSHFLGWTHQSLYVCQPFKNNYDYYQNTHYGLSMDGLRIPTSKCCLHLQEAIQWPKSKLELSNSMKIQLFSWYSEFTWKQFRHTVSLKICQFDSCSISEFEIWWIFAIYMSWNLLQWKLEPLKLW